MELIKKYWWVVLIIVVLVIILLNNRSQNQNSGATPEKCKEIAWDAWRLKKQSIYNSNGGDWAKAHAQMLADGYCEHQG